MLNHSEASRYWAQSLWIIEWTLQLKGYNLHTIPVIYQYKYLAPTST